VSTKRDDNNTCLTNSSFTFTASGTGEYLLGAVGTVTTYNYKNGDLPPSEWPIDYHSLDQEGGIEWLGSTSPRRSSASRVKDRIVLPNGPITTVERAR
jgi:hypothetical protein